MPFLKSGLLQPELSPESFHLGALQFCGGLDITKLTKTPLIYSV